MPKPSASVAVVGAGDYIGAAIVRRFAREGYHVTPGAGMARNLPLWWPRWKPREAPAPASRWMPGRRTR
ncbi:MAG: hypothetical protein QOG25_3122 [Acetobacteraceae bacterium]|jgi:NAD(P)-dependent dehydrogenase (short-subunit alcohol dehydrogenase family)|nr:hypothetical protein [Acetobacteraceae bacterium]